MQYFSTLPKIAYNSPITGSKIALTNIMLRSSIIRSVLNNPLIYYKYDLQDGDTPDIVSFKYYGDSYRYWIIMFANQFLDPQWDWPLFGQEFDNYIIYKYNYPYDSTNPNPSINPNTAVYQYQQIDTQYDVNTQTTTVNTTIINQSLYNSLPQTAYNTYTLPTGLVNVTTTRNILTYYQYEFNLNESKRSINLINKVYVDQIEYEFKKLMSQ